MPLIITTTDPVTGEHLNNFKSKPYVLEGEGRLAVKIYFESEENRRTYLQEYNIQKPGTPGHDH